MQEPKEFEFDSADSAPAEKQAPPAPESPRKKKDVRELELQTSDIANAGVLLASQMEAMGYHPVILFGMAASGKTSLLSSLLAVLRTESELEAIAIPGDPILDHQSGYGKFLKSSADQFFGQTVQSFIAGKAPNATKLNLPFFVPVVFQPKGKPEIRVAFMESAGEWYRPDSESDTFFPKLRKEIEEFIRAFPRGISFIHVAPYTQASVRSLNASRAADPKDINTASLALAGALSAYQLVRPDKSRDNHFMLVTKWDAHEVPQASLTEILMETFDAVGPFVEKNYEQAYATFKSLSLRPDQQQLANYCSGIISGGDNTTLRTDNEHRAAVLSFPKDLWRWLYRNVLAELGEPYIDPFPSIDQKKNPIAAAFWKLIDRLFS